MNTNLAILMLAEIALEGHEFSPQRKSLVADALRDFYPERANQLDLDSAMLREIERHQLQFAEVVKVAKEIAAR